jgi:hypothetical protein
MMTHSSFYIKFQRLKNIFKIFDMSENLYFFLNENIHFNIEEKSSFQDN